MKVYYNPIEEVLCVEVKHLTTIEMPDHLVVVVEGTGEEPPNLLRPGEFKARVVERSRVIPCKQCTQCGPDFWIPVTEWKEHLEMHTYHQQQER